MPIAHSQSVPTYAHHLDYKSIAHSSSRATEESVFPARQCPITGVDIAHQGADYHFITGSTIKQLFKYDRPRFNRMAAGLELAIDADAPMSTACLGVSMKVQQIARTYPPEYLMRRSSLNLPKPQTRFCPTTGVDITHQRANCLFVTRHTLTTLSRQDRARFDQLVVEILTPEQAAQSVGARCHDIAVAARKRGKAITGTE